MTFTVVWKLTAFQQLTRVERVAADPAAVRAAANRVDYTLRRTPKDMGESREPGFRLWYEDDLCVYYRVDDEALRVDVMFVGPARRR
jgi:hypothetical protein